MSTQLLLALTGAGIEVEAFVNCRRDQVPERLRRRDGLTVVGLPDGWQYNRWYSRNDASKYLSGLAARNSGRVRAVDGLLVRHAVRPYDLVYQFSGIELSGLRSRLAEAPPVVLHPEVHAAGELRWHRREAHLARQGEGPVRHYAVRAMLTGRSMIQRNDLGMAAGIVSPSRRFGELLTVDCGVDPDRIEVVPNPIDLERFVAGSSNETGERLTLLFVARMSVRKGVDQIVALSHRLADLAGVVRIQVVGDHSLWSDYRHLLTGLDRSVAEYRGAFPALELHKLLRSADAVLQPSLYEPFALTVGEALACGTPVIASDEVGAAEAVSAKCTERYPAGDVDALEAAVRRMVTRLRGGEAAEIRRCAREEAERLFSLPAVGVQLRMALARFSAGGR